MTPFSQNSIIRGSFATNDIFIRGSFAKNVFFIRGSFAKNDLRKMTFY